MATRHQRDVAITLFVYSVADASNWDLLGTIAQTADGAISCDPDDLSCLLNRPKVMGLDPMMFLDGWSNGYISITHRRKA